MDRLVINLVNDQTAPTLRDIERRADEIIRSQYPLQQEQRLSRLVHGSGAGFITLTAEETQEISDYVTYVLSIRDVQAQAVADAALLSQALEYEAAAERLAQPLVSEDPEIPATVNLPDGDGVYHEVPNPKIVKDTQERDAAQAVINNALPEVVTLVQERAQARAPAPA